MLQLKIAIAACLLASVLLSTVATHAATYYVTTNGNNGNPGTSSQPWRTVAYAVSRMSAGDTTYVRGGTYNEVGIRFRYSGTSAQPIKLINYPNEFPIIDFINQNDPSHRILIQNASGYNRAIGWITIEGFEIRDGYEAIKYYNLHDSVIRRNWIHDNVNQGVIGPGSTRVLITRNRINHNGPFATNPTSTQAHGLYLHGSALTITNNVIYDNIGYGLQQNGSSTSAYSPTKHAGPEFAGAANWIIANNTFAYSKNRGGMVLWGSRCTNARIENNIFYENAVAVPSTPQGIDCTASCAPATGIQIRNNHFYASGSGGTVGVGPLFHAGTVITGNVTNVSAPAFVDGGNNALPASPDFRLTAQSPAIDKGLPLAEGRIAFDGTTRPQGRDYDIGAYEYRADGDAQSPAPVQNVQIR